MSLMLVGINHKTAPVEIREQLDVSEAQQPEAIQSLVNLPSIEGATIISTCNRVETYLSSESEDVADQVVAWMAARTKLSRGEIEKHLYVLRHSDVVQHLFRVASGLDSMIVGEPQIGGQVRKSFQTAQTSGTLDPLLLQLFEQTFRVAKRVRSETGIGEHAVSVPFAAVELAKKIFGELADLEVLLLGAGEIGELTAEHLSSFGPRAVFVANRAYERAVELAARFKGEAVTFDAFEERLETCDIVIVSTGAPHYVVTPDHIHAALANRRRRNLFLIDLAVPRNVDPQIAEIKGVYLYNVDDLQDVASANMEKRLKKTEQAEEIIEREVESFRKRIANQDAVPTIVELQSRFEAIRAAELEKCLRKLGPITTEQRGAVEMLSTQIINKIAHYPIVQLKESAAQHELQERETLRQTIRKIFGLA